MKRLHTLGERERAVVEERRRTGYRVEQLTTLGGELEEHLRALLDRLLPGAGNELDLAAFVDANLDHRLGRGSRAPGVPAGRELVRIGVEALARLGFAGLQEVEQDALVGHMRRGDADGELGIPAKDFVDRVLLLALAGYLAHPATWERIGFHGPAYPDGYAWISRGAVARRHEGFVGADRL